MESIRVNKLRAHHVANLYLDFLKCRERMGRNLSGLIADHVRSENRVIVEYPIEVVDVIDPICDACRKYPEINFCRGSHIRSMDRIAARRLGVTIDEKYSKTGLLRVFSAVKKRDKLRISRNLERYIVEFRDYSHED
ncbi:MAG: hypothetical protein WC796_01355 [Candidatus Pacearchaeota archaeon]|jgi:hypothetical protein